MLTQIEYKLRLKHCAAHNLSKFLAKTMFYKDRYVSDTPPVGSSARILEHPEAAQPDSDCWFVMTSDTPDRDGDRVMQAGMDTTFLEQYGSVLWGHQSDHPDFVLGRVCDIVREEHRALVNVEFASADVNPVAQRVKRMIQDKMLSGMSIGFLVKSFEESHDREGLMPLDIHSSEIIETSITPIPMNAQAVVERSYSQEDKKDLLEIIDRTIEETPAGAQEEVKSAAAELTKEFNNNRIYSIPDSALKEIVQMSVRTLMDID